MGSRFGRCKLPPFLMITLVDGVSLGEWLLLGKWVLLGAQLGPKYQPPKGPKLGLRYRDPLWGPLWGFEGPYRFSNADRSPLLRPMFPQ